MTQYIQFYDYNFIIILIIDQTLNKFKLINVEQTSIIKFTIEFFLLKKKKKKESISNRIDVFVVVGKLG